MQGLADTGAARRPVGFFAALAALFLGVMWFIALVVLRVVNPAWDGCDNLFGTYGRIVVGGIERGLQWPSLLAGGASWAVALVIALPGRSRVVALLAASAVYAGWFLAVYFFGEALFGSHRCIDAY